MFLLLLSAVPGEEYYYHSISQMMTQSIKRIKSLAQIFPGKRVAGGVWALVHPSRKLWIFPHDSSSSSSDACVYGKEAGIFWVFMAPYTAGMGYAVLSHADSGSRLPQCHPMANSISSANQSQGFWILLWHVPPAPTNDHFHQVPKVRHLSTFLLPVIYSSVLL